MVDRPVTGCTAPGFSVAGRDTLLTAAGVGTDLLAVGRIKEVYERHSERLVKRLFTPSEQQGVSEHPEPIKYLDKPSLRENALAR